MKTLFMRLVVYLLLPTGMALMSFPLDTHRRESRERDVFFLEIMGAPLSRDVLPSPVVTAQYLNRFPALATQADIMVRQAALWRQDAIKARQLERVPVEEWTAFGKSLASQAFNGTFQYQDHLFRGRVQSRFVNSSVEIPGLKRGYRIAGSFFLLLGLLAWGASFRPAGRGIPIGPRKAVLLWDAIVVVVGLMFTWWALDMLLVKLFRVHSFWGEDPILGMGLFWVAAVAPFMALFVTTTALQNLTIDSEKIAVKGLFGNKTLVWSDVRSIHIFELYTPRKVAGMLAPHGTTRRLHIKGPDTTLRIMEPPLRSTKQDILDRLAAHAPQELQANIAACARQWTSFW